VKKDRVSMLMETRATTPNAASQRFALASMDQGIALISN
jgi:hypothetical protein